MEIDSKSARPRAVIVGVQLPEVSEAEHTASMRELSRLVHTLGYEVTQELSQKRGSLSAGAVVGEGKLRELAELTGGTGVVPSGATRKVRRIDVEAAEATDEGDGDGDGDGEGDGNDGVESGDRAGAGGVSLVAVDHELTPTQARNLERAVGVTVLDRTAVILEIFHRHAQSREARLQVEIARLNYVAPRLREGGGADRQRGGIGAKGAGESALELDRRRIRDRIAELKRELASVANEQGVRRSRRNEHKRVALVGYTNAGKSSLMRALTGSEVYVADKLFATLDTTVRALYPEGRPKVLVSDTVGFIKKLPHDLVASFRSTLDEAREAALLLHVVDGSDPEAWNQLAVTREVLEEIGAGEVASRLVVNKVDQMTEAQRRETEERFPQAVLVSARDPDGVARVRRLILDHFAEAMERATLRVPYAQSKVVGEVHRTARVIEESWGEEGAELTVLAEPHALARLRALLAVAEESGSDRDEVR